MVKGLTRKQLITILERDIRNDNACITEYDLQRIYKKYGDGYNAEMFQGEVLYTLERPNKEWEDIRMFLPRGGDILKGLLI